MKKTKEEFISSMKSQVFGVEIEFTGISRDYTKEILANYFNSSSLIDNKGREWHVKYDGSIRSCRHTGCNTYEYVDDASYRVELVTPLLGYTDISLLQSIAALIKQAGGVTGAKYHAGIHIHVNEDGQTKDTLRNLIRLMSSKQYLICKALNISDLRLSEYCSYVDENLKRYCRSKFKDLLTLEEYWNDTSNRYRMLNLDSYFDSKGIELRMFNSTLNKNLIKAYIQFSLALCQFAKDLEKCTSEPPKNTNEKYAMRNWLNRMYLTGNEFKILRKVMMRHLSGDSAFADPSRR